MMDNFLRLPDGRIVLESEYASEQAYTQFLGTLGHDTAREGLKATPARHTRFMRQVSDRMPFDFTTFEGEGYDQMIVQSGIQFYSLCEHHVVPFFGEAVVAYIPRKRIVGLSKLARAVEFHARGLQNQERITKAVADMIEKHLKPKGVAVILKARHLCMEMRGARKPGVHTTTTCLHGVFKKDAACRSELMAQVNLSM